jgi:hypothetical protein
VHLVLSAFARQVIHDEIDELQVRQGAAARDKSMNVPLRVGSTLFDAHGHLPVLDGDAWEIAAGTSDSAIIRALMSFLKERRKLGARPARDTVEPHPWRANSLCTLLEAARDRLCPLSPGFYSRPQGPSKRGFADTVPWTACLGQSRPSRARAPSAGGKNKENSLSHHRGPRRSRFYFFFLYFLLPLLFPGTRVILAYLFQIKRGFVVEKSRVSTRRVIRQERSLAPLSVPSGR